jgi:hypothetical protein
VGNALRLIFVGSAVLNLFLAYKTTRVALGGNWSGVSGDDAVQSWTQGALNLPGGRALVLVAAAVMAGIATSLVVRLVRGKYINQFAAPERKGTHGAVVKGCAWYGFLAQAVVAILIAWFLWRAGLTEESEEAGGFTKAAATLLRQPFGRTLLGITGAGLVAQGLYIWLMVPYREIRVRKPSKGFQDHWGRAWGT